MKHERILFKPIVNEIFADNGEHSHWQLVDARTGETLWEEGVIAFTPQELKEFMYEYNLGEITVEDFLKSKGLL